MTALRLLGDSEPEEVTADVTVLHPDWESLYRDNIVGIYHLVHRRVGNAADAEDLAEEVLMHTLKTLRLSASVNNSRARQLSHSGSGAKSRDGRAGWKSSRLTEAEARSADLAWIS